MCMYVEGVSGPLRRLTRLKERLEGGREARLQPCNGRALNRLLGDDIVCVLSWTTRENRPFSRHVEWFSSGFPRSF